MFSLTKKSYKGQTFTTFGGLDSKQIPYKTTSVYQTVHEFHSDVTSQILWLIQFPLNMLIEQAIIRSVFYSESAWKVQCKCLEFVPRSFSLHTYTWLLENCGKGPKFYFLICTAMNTFNTWPEPSKVQVLWPTMDSGLYERPVCSFHHFLLIL